MSPCTYGNDLSGLAPSTMLPHFNFMATTHMKKIKRQSLAKKGSLFSSSECPRSNPAGSVVQILYLCSYPRLSGTHCISSPCALPLAEVPSPGDGSHSHLLQMWPMYLLLSPVCTCNPTTQV